MLPPLGFFVCLTSPNRNRHTFHHATEHLCRACWVRTWQTMTSMVRLSNAIKVTPTALLSHSYCIILIDSSTRLLPHATSHGASCAPADSINLLFKALAAFIDYATAREVGFSISVPLYCGDPAAHSQSGSTQPEDSRIKNYGMLMPVVCSK